MTFHFRPAVREGIKPLIGLYAQSGAGKTMSSLLMARGMVGPQGRILLIDTESGRGNMFSDQIPGGYDVLDLGKPFSPKRYIGAIEAGEAEGYDIIIIDSVSHEWEGIGGVCDQAAEKEARGKPGLHNWKDPKAEHQKFVLRLLQSKTAVIICMRAKYKTRQTRVNGKTEIIKDNFTSPIQAEDFIFEMTAHLEIRMDHTVLVTKGGHPDLATCFPEGSPISIKTGEAITAWANGGKESPSAVKNQADARAAASKGRTAWDKWWAESDKTAHEHVKGILDDLKRRVSEAEDPLGAEEQDERFPGDLREGESLKDT